MKLKLSLIALACFASPSLFAIAAEPSSILFSCKSKQVNDTTTQIYGNLTDAAMHDVTYINIDVWDPDSKPIVRKGEVWTADAKYKPTKKYEGSQRYIIQTNTPKLVGYELIMPSKSTIYALALQRAGMRGNKSITTGFGAVLRFREDYHDDLGGQEYLECSTGWIDVR